MSFGEIAVYGIVLLLLLVVCMIFFKPLKRMLALGFQSLLGGVCLYICNFPLALVGMGIGVNIVTASVCGLFGLPGLALLLILKFLFSFA